jgi:hypothetical protein
VTPSVDLVEGSPFMTSLPNYAWVLVTPEHFPCSRSWSEPSFSGSR